MHSECGVLAVGQSGKSLKGRFLFIYIFELLVFIGVELIKNVVIVSGEQGRDLVTHIHVSILPQTPLPSRLPHNTEQSSLCYTISPCCYIHFKNCSVCMTIPDTLNYPFLKC